MTNSDAPTNDDPTNVVFPRRWAKWWPGLLIAFLGFGSLALAWWVHTDDNTARLFDVAFTMPATFLLLAIWWTFFSPPPLMVRLAGWGVVGGVVLLAAGVFFSMYRIDGFRGELRPIIVPRNTPTKEERARDYFAQQKAAASKSAAEAAARQRAHSEKLKPDATFSSEDWPSYRGPSRDGIIQTENFRDNWEADLPTLLWKHPIGLGWSSFIAVGNLIYTQEQRDENEVVSCYDLETGDEVWTHLDQTRFKEAAGGDGPRATPTYADGRLYTLGATGILNCLDPQTGEKLWSRPILEESGATNIDWGMAGSPLVDRGLVIVNPGGSSGKSVMAFDAVTGAPKWSAGNEPASYSAPQAAVLGGFPQILIFDGTGLAGHDPATGAPLWRFPWSNSPKVNAAQPILIGQDQVFIANGYSIGAAAVQVRFERGKWSAASVWENRKFQLKFNSAVLHDGHIYGLNERVLSCLLASDGKILWKAGRYGYGQMILVNDRLLILAETGEVALVKAVPEGYQELSRFQALEGNTWNHPILTRGRLLVRNGEEAACFNVAPR